MLFNNVPLKVQQFEHSVLSPEFPGAVDSLSCCKLLTFLERIWFFFFDFWTIEYLISLFNSRAASRVSLFVFIALMESATASWRAWPWHCVKWTQSCLCVLLLQSYHQPWWIRHHNIELYNLLMFNSTQGILNTIE